MVYLDDIIAIAPDFDTHLQRLEEVLQRFKGTGPKLKFSKCELLQSRVRYLRHVVSGKRVAMDLEKTLAVRQLPNPRGHRELQGFLDTMGYY